MIKKFKNIIAIFIIATIIMPQSILAYSKHIIIGGENIGLEINNNGVIVAGFYKVGDTYPGIDAALSKGDIITRVDNTKISNVNEFITSIKNSNQKYINIGFKRNNKDYRTILNFENDDNVIKTGLFVKDMISGIGTLTYIDPNTKTYGALGHEVIETSSGIMLNVKDGKIYSSKVTGIDKSTRGSPGSKNADVDSNSIYGDIKENTKYGIFGKYQKEINTNKLYEVGEYEDIKIGTAKIVTTLDDNEKKEYEINILKINNIKNDNKNILFDIVDEKLLSKTGGIIQGMSGSPIIQNGKIIGAVTNVVVNNPKRGYGILITTMLEESEN